MGQPAWLRRRRGAALCIYAFSPFSLHICSPSPKIAYMQKVVQSAIRGSMFGRAELARRAGVSASTITRIEKGTVDPTLGMATRILAATGLQFIPRLEPLCIPDAIGAARAVLDDTFTPGANAAMFSALKRWASRDGSPQPRSLAREAGIAAPPTRRPGALLATSEWSFLRICSAVAATRKRWAVSGAPAAARIGAHESTGPIILYVEEPERIRHIINKPQPGARDVILLPLDETSQAGAWNDENVVWADPLQIILDCYGIPDTREQADELTRDWEETDD
ncbi:helix-turn-helix domain-containing protein [Paenarthrobacter sp. NPDC056912]|uniref:helix-turn-helix domain-containing protein n=1 Tax=Paenarthrobacter sp. NPDC056912 TaxID=3345965 RepID=UPI00366D9D42